MVYVSTKLSNLNKYLKKKLSVKQISDCLFDMGMELKEFSKEKDSTLKIEVTAERFDMVHVIGVARAINYYLGFENKLKNYKINKANYKVYVKNSVSKIRPCSVGIVIKDIKMTQKLLDELIEFQEKIHETFGRNRRKVSIGLYRLNVLNFPLIYEAKNPKDINFIPLNETKIQNGYEILKNNQKGKEFSKLISKSDKYPVLRDSKNNVLSLIPIINSNDSGKVTKKDKDLFIECSGHNLTFLDMTLKVLTTTILELGGKAYSCEVIYDNKTKYKLDLSLKDFFVSFNYIKKIIGVDIKQSQMKKLLLKNMCELESISKSNILKIKIPSYKFDIWNDCDVADDIAKAYGYNNIKPFSPNILSFGEHLEVSKFRESFSEKMCYLGFLENYTYMTTSTKYQLENLDKNEEYIKLVNSVEQGTNMLRLKIFPELLRSLNFNRKNKYPQKIFENGFVVNKKGEDEITLCSIIADPNSNYNDIKNILDTILKIHNIKFTLKKSKENFLIEGRRADIFVKGKNVGFIGEMEPKIIKRFKLLVPISLFEINLEKIFNLN